MSHPDTAAPLRAVGALFSRYPRQFWIAGGWAIDLFAGRTRRPHWDVDVLILTADLAAFSDAFTGCAVSVEDHQTGDKRPWAFPIPLTPGRHTLYFADDTVAPHSLEILVGRSDGNRRSFISPTGLPFLAPEVVLMMKAHRRRVKDDRDFNDLVPLLNAGQRDWLLQHLGAHHPWHTKLQKTAKVT